MDDNQKKIPAISSNRPSHLFKPGQSGNPLGRSRGHVELRGLARAHTAAAVNKLVELIDHPDGRVAIAACTAILDRGYGRPTQSVEIVKEETAVLESMDVAALLAIAQERVS